MSSASLTPPIALEPPLDPQARPVRLGAPVRRLLGYVTRHRKYAGLTALFGVLGFALSFAYPWIVGSVVDTVAAPRGSAALLEERTRHVFHLAVLSLLIAVGHAIVVYGRGHFNVHLGHAVVSDIRRALLRHLQTLSVRFFTKERTGVILARVMHDVHEATTLIYTGVIVAVLDCVQLVVAVVLLASISWKLTLACFFLFPLYAVVFARMNPRVRTASEQMHAAFSRISGNVAEQLSGQALIKTYTAEEREAERFAKDVERHHELVVAQSHQGHLVAAAGEVLVHLGTTIVVGYGGWLALRGELTPGVMTRFLGYMLIMFGPVRRFAELNITYQTSLSAMRRVFRVLDVTPSIVDTPRARIAPPSLGHVRFEHVFFRYEDRSAESRTRLDEEGPPSRPSLIGPWVLEDITLEAQPGERIAIVGPSGAGKTTLVSLLPRLYEVAGGRVVIDGVDVRDYALHSLRSAIAIVQQDSFLFSCSIRDNIGYGRPDATDEDLVRAAVAAHAHEFIVRLPHGYDTTLGERGVNLSGGQRQRISIARALLKNPRILILDEATSSLDTESEAVVQSALDRLMRARTCFIVAHRLSTIRSADRIVVLDQGRVAEVGSHDQLVVREGGVYARLVQHQTLLSGS